MRWIAVLGLLGGMLFPASASALELEPIGEFNLPMFVTSYPEDPDKLLVVERPGRVQQVEGGTRSVFLDATPLIGTFEGEQGLQSIALSPDFASSGKLYAFYAGSETGGDIQIDEFTAVGDSVDPSTRRPVLTIEHSHRDGHYGGQMEFGPDGYLYVTTGDGDVTSEYAQSLDRRLGKLLRIDPRAFGQARYTVPSDNPFVGADDGAADEIWSYGLRNPFSLAFDRVTGALAIADVGRRAREEIDYDDGANPGRGSNFGWACFEGSVVNHPPEDDPACESPENLVFPIFEYPRTNQNCAIIGGRVVRDPGLGADLNGRYLYADFCAGQLRSLVPEMPNRSDRDEGLDLGRPVNIDEDCAGRIYVSTLTSGTAGTGDVSQLVGDGPGDPAMECDPPDLPPQPGPPDPDTDGPGPTPPGPIPISPGGPLTHDSQPPQLRLGGAATQHVGGDHRLGIKLISDEFASASVKPRIVPSANGGDRRVSSATRAVHAAKGPRFDLVRKVRGLAPGETRRIKWRLTRRQVRRSLAALRDGVRLEVRFAIVATDATGNRTKATERFRLAR